MSKESKGKEFFESLSPVEKQVILEIMKLENSHERLIKKSSSITEEQIKKIIAQNAMEWNRK